MSDELYKTLDQLPFSEEKRQDILRLSTSSDYRALLINDLINILDKPAETELKAIQILSEAKAIKQLLKISLRTSNIKEPIVKSKQK